MPISFRSKGGDSPSNIVLKLSKSIQPNAGDLQYAAVGQRARIITRTGQGRDVNGNPFHAYTAAYAKRKAKSGRDSGIVDLTWSGLMLKAMRILVNSMGFVIGIYGSEGIRAAAHNFGQGKQPQRAFMGASPEDRAAMARDIEARCIARANGTSLNGMP